MPDTPSPPTPEPVTADDLRVLLGIAGLTLAADRAPDVLAELNAQLAHARQFDSLLKGAREPDFAPYDPAFPRITLEDDAT